MDIHDVKVSSPTFGEGVVTEQSEETVTVLFNGASKKFLYPSCFEQYLTAQDPAIQQEIRSEIASIKAAEARRQRKEHRRALILAEQQKAEARKNSHKK